MKKGMRAVLALAMALALPAQMFAAPTKATAPQNADTTGFLQPQTLPNLEFIGAIPGSVPQGTYSSLIATGAGVLYAICPSLGGFGESSTQPAITNYVIAFDTALVANLLGGASGAANVNTVSVMPLSPAVFPNGISVAASGAAGASMVGGTESQCWQPRIPVQFQNGLVVSNSNPTFATVVYWRPMAPVSGGSGSGSAYY